MKVMKHNPPAVEGINFLITYLDAARQIAFAGFLRKPAKKISS